jgi:hypothetical protein
MSEEAEPLPSHQPAKTRLVFKIALVLVLVFIAFLFLPSFFMAGRAGVLGAVALGWWSFLQRTLPGISWNWDIVGMSAVCVLLILILAHVFLRWITKSVSSAQGRRWQWPWRWTWCGLLAIGLLFLVGMGVGGMAHQAGWLSSRSGSWYEIKGEDFSDLRQLDGALQQAALEAGGDILEMRRVLRSPDSSYFPRGRGENSLLERFQVLLIRDETNALAGRIIFPRDPARWARARGIYSFADRNDNFPMEQLPKLIQKHQQQLLAF